MPVVDAYAERKAERVMRDTWGHLDDVPGIKHHGIILFAEGAFGGERVILRSRFGAGGYGPWFYEGIHEWLGEQDMEDGRIYRFEGWYRLCKNGRHQFVGKVREYAYPC
jgi:hypothetical protein